MRLDAGRRAFLKLAAAGLVAGSAAARGEARPELRELARWATGNGVLRPPAAGQGLIYFCGDRTFGAAAPGERELRWKRELAPDDGGAAFRPRLGGSRLVIAGSQVLSAYEPETGGARWTYRARRQIGVPLVGDSHVCFGDGHEIVALDTDEGREIWRFAGVPDTLASYAPALAGDTVFAGPGDGRLYALSLADGRLRWQADRRGQWQYLRQLHIAGSVVVAGSYKEKLFGLAAADGGQLWEFNAGNFINSHHVAGGTAYLWSPTGWLYAIDTATGRVRWRHLTTDYGSRDGNWAPMMAELVTSGDHLLALDMANVLHVLHIGDGREIARARVPAAVRHAVLPVPGAGFVFPTADGDLLLTART